MASCPHCHTALRQPATFCGGCGQRVGEAATPAADDPGATTRLDAPAAQTQPMRAPPSLARSPASDAALDDARARAPLGAAPLLGPRVSAVALIAGLTVLAVGMAGVGKRGARSAPPASAAAPLPPDVYRLDDPAPPTALRPTPHRVGRAGLRATPGSASAAGPAATGHAAAGDPYAILDQHQQGSPAAPPAPAISTGAPGLTPASAAPTSAALAPGATPVAGAAVAVAPAAPPAAAAAGAAEPSRSDVAAAAEYMRGGGEVAPPSSEELADRDRAEGYAGSIRMVARAHGAQVSACYERAFKTGAPTQSARVEVGFTVDKTGLPGKVRAVSNSSGSEALANCLAQRVATWRFPRPPGGDFDAIYPFVFSGAR